MRSARSRASARGRWSELVAERAANGPFKSLEDFADRVDPRLLNRRQLESLAAAGAFERARAAIARRCSPAPRRSSPHAACRASARDQRAGRAVRRRGRWRRRAADPAAARSRTGRSPSGWRRRRRRSASISPRTRPIAIAISRRRTARAASPNGARCRRRPQPSPTSAAAASRADRRDGGAGRGCALAHLGARQPLSDGDLLGRLGAVHGELLRRRRSPSASRRRPRRAAAGC